VNARASAHAAGALFRRDFTTCVWHAPRKRIVSDFSNRRIEMPTNPNNPNVNDPNKNKQQQGGDQQRQPQNQPGQRQGGDIGKEPMRQPGQQQGNDPDQRERKGQGI
jgi:hypothetical protein